MFVTLQTAQILKLSFGRVQWAWKSCMAHGQAYLALNRALGDSRDVTG